MSYDVVKLICDGPAPQHCRLVDSKGEPIPGVFRVEFEASAGHLNRAIVHLDWVGTDAELHDPEFVVDCYGNHEVPLPRGLTAAQAHEIREAYSVVIDSLKRLLEEAGSA